MSTLVTGTSGRLGRHVVKALLARGARPASIVATARNVAAIAELTSFGVRTAELDYNRPDTIESALHDVDAVLLVSSSEMGNRVAQHRNVIEAAVKAGVSKLVYTSAPRATTSPLVVNPEHKGTEETIAELGVPAVILRNGWYTENYAQHLAYAAQTGILVASAGAGRVASASRIDYAEAAAVVLLEDGHVGSVYELAGDVAWDFQELAAAMSEVLGRPVQYTPLTTEEHLAALQAAGLDPALAGFLTAVDANIRDGLLAVTDGTLSRLIGRPTTPLVDGLRAINAG
jgi:NAD(P)H dehydrogenase (quinone)